MIFHVFLFHPSLQWRGGDETTSIIDRLIKCQEVALYIKKFPEAHRFLFWKEEFLDTAVDEDGTSIKSLLLNPKIKGYVGKTVANAIMPILKEAKGTGFAFDDLETYLDGRENLGDAEQDVGLLVCDVESPFETVIGCCDDILNLRLNIILAGRFTSDKLRREGKYVFDRLIFSRLNDAKFKDVAKSHPNKIVNALRLLNDCFPEEYFELLKSKSKDDALEEFGIVHSEIDGCSSEAYEESFDIEFELENGTKLIKRCTPHLKLNSNDQGQSKQYARIYFALPSSKDEPLYVGRIITHAETKKSKGKKKK